MVDEKNTLSDLIYLTNCAIKSEIPNAKRISKMNLKQLFYAAKRHMMTAIIADVLEKAGIEENHFMEAKAKAKRKCALLEIETASLTNVLESEKIWYMPLKGAILKNYYPVSWMREMTDVDILFDSSFRKQVKAIMTELGFVAENYNESNHDCYKKAPVCEFEMHTSILSASYSNLTWYYADIEKRFINEQTGYLRELSNEDFYIFMIVHTNKHYYCLGTGIRPLLDIYLFLNSSSVDLDKDYIRKELDKLKLIEFEMKIRELAFCLFEGKPISDVQEEMLEYMFIAGLHGIRDNLLKNQLLKYGCGWKAKIKYCISRIFPPSNYIKECYPFVYKSKILIPFLPIYRMSKGLILNRKHFKNEIEGLRNI